MAKKDYLNVYTFVFASVSVLIFHENFSFYICSFNRFAEGKSDKEILDHLLKNSRYDKRLLPPVDGKLIYSIFFSLFKVIYIFND